MKNLLNLSEVSNLAVHALSVMQHLDSGETVSVTRLADALKVSESHLAKVMQRLVKEGIIDSTRGAKGGFFHNGNLKSLTLLKLVTLLDGPLQSDGCLLGEPICGRKQCRMQATIKRVSNVIADELSQIHIGDIGPKRLIL